MRSDEHWKPSYTTSTHVCCMHTHTHTLTSLHCDMVLAARCSSSALGQSSCSFLPPSTWVIPLRSSTRDVRRWTGHKSVCCVWVCTCVCEWMRGRERIIIMSVSVCVCTCARVYVCELEDAPTSQASIGSRAHQRDNLSYLVPVLKPTAEYLNIAWPPGSVSPSSSSSAQYFCFTASSKDSDGASATKAISLRSANLDTQSDWLKMFLSLNFIRYHDVILLLLFLAQPPII